MIGRETESQRKKKRECDTKRRQNMSDGQAEAQTNKKIIQEFLEKFHK